MLTHEVARELARQQVRYAELTITPYSHVRRGIPAPAFCEAIEDARKRGRGRLRHRAALVLRHPRRGRAAGRRGDAADRARRAAGRADQLRPGRPRDRRAPAAVQAVLRPGPGGRAALACRTPARPPARRRSGTRCASWAPSGSGTASPPRRTRSCWPTWPSGGSRWRSARPPTCGPGRWPRLDEHPLPQPGRRRACWSPSTPTTRRCSAPRSTTSTRSPPGCSAAVRAGWPRWPATRWPRRSSTPAGQARISAEIDAYVADRLPARPLGR